jgi:peptidoglycan/LPS O-acetylase OafA/YrhL
VKITLFDLKDTKSHFFPQLDFLRAVAVLLVIVSHWYPKDFILNKYTDNGSIGVTLFFVLSGFLITGILLKSQFYVENGEKMSRTIKVFYVRRALRIFPVYYLLLLILFILDIDQARNTFWWHFFYGSNFLFWLNGHFVGLLSPFWSLAVEEQFYLIWPFVIMFIGRKQLPYLFCFVAVSAMSFRYLIVTDTTQIGRILMPGSLDSFCFGSLIAFGRLYQTSWYVFLKRYEIFFLLLAGLLLVLVHTSFFNNLSEKAYTSFYYFLLSVAFAISIDWLASGVNFKLFTFFLNNPIFLYLGKISYGLYLFHSFIPKIYGLMVPQFLEPFSFYIAEITRLLFLILIASVSWYFFEKPILNFKKYFAYQEHIAEGKKELYNKKKFSHTI